MDSQIKEFLNAIADGKTGNEEVQKLPVNIIQNMIKQAEKQGYVSGKTIPQEILTDLMEQMDDENKTLEYFCIQCAKLFGFEVSERLLRDL